MFYLSSFLDAAVYGVSTATVDANVLSPLNTTQSAVLARQVVRPSVRDVEVHVVTHNHILGCNTSKIISRLSIAYSFSISAECRPPPSPSRIYSMENTPNFIRKRTGV